MSATTIEAPARPRAATPRRSWRTTPRRAAIWLLLLAALVAAVLVSIAVGSREIALSTVIEALTSYDAAVDEHFIVRDMRLPRAATAIAVGAALAVAGALIQALTRNPLADPGILGVSSGAAFFVALASRFSAWVPSSSTCGSPSSVRSWSPQRCM